MRCIFLHSRGNCCSVLRVAPTTPLRRNRLQESPTCPITTSSGWSTTETGNLRNGPTSSRSTPAAATATAHPIPQNRRRYSEAQQSRANSKPMAEPVDELMMSSMKTAMMETITGRMEGREMTHARVEMSAQHHSLLVHPHAFRSVDAVFCSWDFMAR